MPTGGTDIMAATAVIGAVTSAYGMYQSGQAQKVSANAQAQEQNYEAAEGQQAAGQARAASQRDAIADTRNKELTESRAIAQNAGTGGSTLDPSVVDILGDLEGQGQYNANAALYQGETKARNYESGATLANYQAGMDRASGENDANAAMLKAGGSLVSAGSSLYGKYGDPGETIYWNGGGSSKIGGYG